MAYVQAHKIYIVVQEKKHKFSDVELHKNSGSFWHELIG